ncbi:hypothetical protein HPB50_008306 [Hyalomma asiaticum]|uniref:Uncharacterized protein n=1 Tax=Hyalomma asiaticum TaxID=266040 RepID=A0ACB7T036_HYAAI|nr:hypothetical protein HPB50_008306 [Hyalomma asiaticum]
MKEDSEEDSDDDEKDSLNDTDVHQPSSSDRSHHVAKATQKSTSCMMERFITDTQLQCKEKESSENCQDSSGTIPQDYETTSVATGTTQDACHGDVGREAEPVKSVADISSLSLGHSQEEAVDGENKDIVPELVTADKSDGQPLEAHTRSEDSRSVRTSYSMTSCTTIAPEEIKARVKKQLTNKERARSKKVIVKGEASAVTRQRRDNRDTVKQDLQFWG